VAEKERMYPKLDHIGAGDVLIGLPSSGLHSNGYSLVRKILFADNDCRLTDAVAELDGATLADVLLAPTRIYVKTVLSLLRALPEAVHAMVHVTGGGFYDNIPRVLKAGLSAEIDASAWMLPPVFRYLQTLGGLSNEALWHTFNCGIGYIFVVPEARQAEVLDFLKTQVGEEPVVLGQLTETPNLSEVRIR
jgi:phosphoribosylformylglycinamidine cyclo-ligase